jgi:hypothetical protein
MTSVILLGLNVLGFTEVLKQIVYSGKPYSLILETTELAKKAPALGTSKFRPG